MKYLGAALVWLCLSMIGIRVSSRLKKRQRLIENIVMMLEIFSSKINYLMLPVAELIYDFNCDKRSSDLKFIESCALMLDSGYDFPEAWKKSIEQCDYPLKKDEKEKLISYGLSLGKTDTDGHKGIFKIYADCFEFYKKRSQEDLKKYSQLSFALFFMGGCALFILLI